MHDFNPGILKSGLFWTMAMPNSTFRVWDHGRKASLHVEKLPMPDTFVFANNVSVSGAVDVDVRWGAIGKPQLRGKGADVPPDDWAAFEGRFSDATCRGRVKGVETGFWFKTGRLSEEGFFAEMGPERNGTMLDPS